MVVEFKLSIDTENGSFEIVNMGTGEVKEVALPKKTSTRKSKKVEDENPNPQIILGENKYVINTAAVNLMGIEPDDHLIIKYEKNGKTLIPIIGTNESFGNKSGNRVTKSFTVSCRGKANAELLEYGTVFDIVPHETKEGLFVMKGDKIPVIKEEGEDVTVEEATIDDIDAIDISEFTDESEDVTALDFTM